MPKKRVVEFVTYAGIGGMQHMLLEFLRHASRDQFEFFLCVLLEHHLLNDEAERLQIPQTSLNFRGYWDLAAWGKCYVRLKGKKIDLIRTYGLKAHIIGRIVGKLLGIPVNITSVRSTDPWRKWYHVLLDFLTSGLTDLYISNSEAGRMMTHQREHIPLSKILTIHNGIDLARFDPDRVARGTPACKQALGIAPTTPVIGIVANFREMKGHRTIIDALPRIQQQIPKIRCVFIGERFVKEPDYEAELRRYVREKRLDDVVIFTGARKNIPEVLSAIDVFLLPSLWEGLSTAILEAMAMRVPVVASAVGGTPELVEHGVTGFLIPPQDPVALADAVSSLLTDPETAEKMGQAGYERVHRLFSLTAMVTKTETVYAQMIEKKRTS